MYKQLKRHFDNMFEGLTFDVSDDEFLNFRSMEYSDVTLY
jgi:hypothetical protein